MKKFLKWLGIFIFGIFILVTAFGAYFVYNFDLNQYKSYITELVEKEINRKLEIKGNASIGMSLIPTLIIEDVELANASWAKFPQMVKLKKLELKFSILPLFKKQIVIDKIIINAPEIYLETNSNGDVNWEFSKKQNNNNINADNINNDSKKIKVNPAVGIAAGFVAKYLDISDGIISISDMKNNSNNIIRLNNITFYTPSDNENISINFNVGINEENIIGKASIGSLETLLDNEKNYPIYADAKAFGIDAEFNGSVYGILNKPQFAFETNIYNPAGNFNAPETTLTALIEGDLKDINIKISSLNVVNNIITGNISANIAGKIPYINAKLQSELINLQNFSQNSNFAKFELVKSAKATTLAPDIKIPYEQLRKLNATADIKINKLIIDNANTAKNVFLNAVLADGVLNINPLQLDFGNGKIDISGNANSNNQEIRINISSNNLILQQLHKEFSVENNKDFGFLSGGSTDLEAVLTTHGNTYKQLLENLNGQIVTIVGESVIQTGALSFLKGNFISQLLNALNLKNSNTDINLTCAVVRTDIKNGLATFPSGIAVQAKEMSLVSSGDINLKNDTLDFSIQPYTGKIKDFNIAQAISSFIKIKGNIQNPKISIDDKNALKTLTGVAVAGPAYLGGEMLLGTGSSPCYTALEGTKYQSKFPAPSRVENTKNDINKQIDKNINDIKDMAKDIFKALK